MKWNSGVRRGAISAGRLMGRRDEPSLVRAGIVAQMYGSGNLAGAAWIPHLTVPAGVTNWFRCHGGAPFRGWIPAFGDLCITPVAGDSVAEMPGIPSS